MAAAANLDWLFHLLGAALALAGAALLLWALLWDRSRGRRRCPRCWYDMAGVPGRKCPECGREAKLERRLFRTRRRWKWSVGALVILLTGAAVASVPGYRAGWQTLLPTTFLALAAPAEDPTNAVATAFMRASIGSGVIIAPNGTIIRPGAPGPAPTIGETLTDELWRRLREGKFAAWQGRWFVGRYLNAHPRDFEKSIHLPERWPIGVPLQANTTDALPACFGQAFITPHVSIPGGTKEVWPPAVAALDAPTAIGDSVTIRFEIRRAKKVLYRTVFSRPCDIVPDDANFLDRVGGEPWDSRVAAALAPQLAWDPTNKGTIITRDRTSAEKWQVLDLGIAFDIELRDGPDILACGRGAAEWNRPVWKDWEDVSPQWSPGGTDRAIADRKSLRFLVRGNPGEARRQYLEWPWNKRPACWVGQFESVVPVADAGILGGPR